MTISLDYDSATELKCPGTCRSTSGDMNVRTGISISRCEEGGIDWSRHFVHDVNPSTLTANPRRSRPLWQLPPHHPQHDMHVSGFGVRKAHHPRPTVMGRPVWTALYKVCMDSTVRLHPATLRHDREVEQRRAAISWRERFSLLYTLQVTHTARQINEKVVHFMGLSDLHEGSIVSDMKDYRHRGRF